MIPQTAGRAQADEGLCPSCARGGAVAV